METSVIEVLHEEAYRELYNMIETVVGSVNSDNSKRVYRQSARAFANWMYGQQLIPVQLSKHHMITYHKYLSKYANATAQRMWIVAKRVLDEYVEEGLLFKNPMGNMKGFKKNDVTTHLVLSKEEVTILLNQIDQNTKKGIRDFTLFYLLVRLGLRRSECAALLLDDLTYQQGMRILVIRKGKGKKRRINKLPEDVEQVLCTYLKERGEDGCPALFPAMRIGGVFREEALTDNGIYKIVKLYAKKAAIQISHMTRLSPHGLRATSITLKLKAKAPLEKVQYDHGHEDPRTTMGYRDRSDMLEKSSAEYEDWQ